MIKTKG